MFHVSFLFAVSFPLPNQPQGQPAACNLFFSLFLTVGPSGRQQLLVFSQSPMASTARCCSHRRPGRGLLEGKGTVLFDWRVGPVDHQPPPTPTEILSRGSRSEQTDWRVDASSLLAEEPEVRRLRSRAPPPRCRPQNCKTDVCRLGRLLRSDGYLLRGTWDAQNPASPIDWGAPALPLFAGVATRNCYLPALFTSSMSVAS